MLYQVNIKYFKLELIDVSVNVNKQFSVSSKNSSFIQSYVFLKSFQQVLHAHNLKSQIVPTRLWNIAVPMFSLMFYFTILNIPASQKRVG